MKLSTKSGTGEPNRSPCHPGILRDAWTAGGAETKETLRRVNMKNKYQVGSRKATREYYTERKKAVKRMKKQYSMSKKQTERVFHSHISIERIKEICDFSLSRERFFNEFFPETKNKM